MGGGCGGFGKKTLGISGVGLGHWGEEKGSISLLAELRRYGKLYHRKKKFERTQMELLRGETHWRFAMAVHPKVQKKMKSEKQSHQF